MKCEKRGRSSLGERETRKKVLQGESSRTKQRKQVERRKASERNESKKKKKKIKKLARKKEVGNEIEVEKRERNGIEEERIKEDKTHKTPNVRVQRNATIRHPKTSLTVRLHQDIAIDIEIYNTSSIYHSFIVLLTTWRIARTFGNNICFGAFKPRIFELLGNRSSVFFPFIPLIGEIPLLYLSSFSKAILVGTKQE